MLFRLFAALLAALVGLYVLVDVFDVLPIYILGVDEPVRASLALPAVAFQGKYAVTHQITARNTKRHLAGMVVGPEHVALRPLKEADSAQELWMSSKNGTMYRLRLTRDGKLAEETLEQMVYAGPGRVLGFDFAGADSMYLCNSLQGLMHWNMKGPLELVATRVSLSSPLHPGRALHFVNSAAVSDKTGKVYFTSATSVPTPYYKGAYQTMKAAMQDGLIGLREGMVLEYDSTSGETICLRDGLRFANGIALASDSSYAVVVETYAVSVWKLWLTGSKAGTLEPMLGEMPCFPDNVHRVASAPDKFWVGCVLGVTPAFSNPMLFPSKMFRWAMGHVPEDWGRRIAKNVAGGVEFDGDGRVTRVIADTTGDVASSTPSGLFINNGKTLVMGTLMRNDVFSVAVDS